MTWTGQCSPWRCRAAPRSPWTERNTTGSSGSASLKLDGAAAPRKSPLPSWPGVSRQASADALCGPGHAAVDGKKGGALFVGETLIDAYGVLGSRRGGLIRCIAHGRVDEARLGEQRFRGNVEGVRNGFKHPHRRLVQATLNLAQVRVGQAGQLRELAQRQVGHLALGTDEGAKRLAALMPCVGHRRPLMQTMLSEKRRSCRG